MQKNIKLKVHLICIFIGVDVVKFDIVSLIFYGLHFDIWEKKAQYMVFSNLFENEEENKVFYDELELDLEQGKMEVIV